MRPVHNRELLQHYIEQFSLERLFSKDIKPYMSLWSCPKRQVVCANTSQLNTMYFLVEGKLAIYHLQENGKVLLIRFNKPLSVIGDLEFLNHYPVKCNVESQVDSILIGIPFEVLKQRAYDDPKFLRFIIDNLSHKLFTISNAAVLNTLLPLENRLASYLMAISTTESDNRAVQEIKTTKLTEIAMLLGTSYRHLCRVIRTLEQQNVISSSKGYITILDINALRKLAKDNLFE